MRADDIFESHELAEQTLQELKQWGLPATPRNFELWLIHVSRRNPKLSSDIEGLQKAGDAIPEAAIRALHDQYMKQSHLPGAVMDVAVRVEREIADILEHVVQSGDNARVYGKQLSGASDELGKVATSPEALRELVTSLVDSTKKMEAENAALQERLTASSNEITSLQRSVETIRMEAFTDPLTGVGNRKCFDTSVEQFIQEAEAEGHELCVAMADIDHFKKFNDTYGHQTGDQVIRLVAAAMDANIKGQDLLARYGGEEFAILLPKTTLENAGLLADRIRRTVETRRLRKRSTNEDLGTITISIGIAQHRPGESLETMIERADQCLYDAKRKGRNRVVCEDKLDGALHAVSAA